MVKRRIKYMGNTNPTKGEIDKAFSTISDSFEACSSASDLSVLFIEYQNIMQSSFLKAAAKLHENEQSMCNNEEDIEVENLDL